MQTITTVETAIGPLSYISAVVTEKNVIVVLDKSGSMSITPSGSYKYGRGNEGYQSRLDYAKMAIAELQESVTIDTLIVFDNNAQCVSLQDLATVNEDGGTEFCRAFELTTSHFEPGFNVILLITDGETYPDDVTQSIATIESRLKEMDDVQVQVHSLGINASPVLLLRLAQVDVPGSVVHLADASDIQKCVSELVRLIDGAAPFKLVETPTDSSAEVTQKLEDMEPTLVATLIETLLKNVTKLDPGEMNAECNRVQTLLQSVKNMSDDDRVKLRRLIRELRQVAVQNLPQSELAIALAGLCYNPNKNLKLGELGNRRALTNYETAEKILDNEKNEPFEFDKELFDDLVCVISQETPEDAYKDGGMFGVCLWWDVDNPTRVANPEKGFVVVQNVFMSWESFTQSVLFKPDRENGVLCGLDGVRVYGFLPLVPNRNGRDMLKLCAALYSAGDYHAISSEATNALPFLALLNIYTRPEAEWLEKIRKLVLPMCRLVQLSNIKQTAEEFGTPSSTTPDKIPSLPLFLMRCIVAEIPITDALFAKVFREAARRFNRRQDWSLKNLWTSVTVPPESVSLDELIQEVVDNWKSDKQSSTYRPVTGSIRGVPNEVFILRKMNEVKQMWDKSVLMQVVNRHFKTTEAPKDPAEQLITEKNIDAKIEFLAGSLLRSEEVKSGVRPVVKPQVDGQDMYAQKQAGANLWLERYCETTSITEAAAIIGRLTLFEVSQLMVKLRNDPKLFNIPLYGLKSGGLTKDFMLRVEEEGEVNFLEVSTNPASR